MIELVSSGSSTEQKLAKQRASWEEQRRQGEAKAKELERVNAVLEERAV
jgi:hypothetical protein